MFTEAEKWQFDFMGATPSDVARYQEMKSKSNCQCRKHHQEPKTNTENSLDKQITKLEKQIKKLNKKLKALEGEK